MTLRGTVEAVARAIAVYGFDVRRLSVVVDETGVSVQPAGGACSSVDDLTAALLLLGHARGLRVDLGECPACVARSGKRDGRLVLARWEWMQHIWGEANEHWPGDIRGEGWSATAFPFGRVGPAVIVRPCQACTIDGKPTSRHTIPWAQALLDARPPRVRPSARDWGALGHAMAAADVVLDGPSLVRTNLAVLADKMQAAGDPLGVWLAVWLGGPCPGCPACNGAGLAIRCHGHGTLLGEHEPDLLAALDPLTWISDRLPRVGDRITVRHAFGDGEHFTGVVSEIEARRPGDHVLELDRVRVSGWWSNIADGWRYA